MGYYLRLFTPSAVLVPVADLQQALLNRGSTAQLEANDEGFDNEAGYLVLWQFHDDVSGPWKLAVRESDAWTCFEMDLGDRTARNHFFQGKVPPGAETWAD